MYPLSQVTVATRVKNAVAAGQTDQDGIVLDQADWDAIQGVATLGAVTDASQLELQLWGSPNADGSAAALVATTGVIGALGSSNKVIVLDVIRPQPRYLFFRVKRGGQNAALDSMLAIQYRCRDTKLDINQGATIQSVTTVIAG